jgi:hypothetical protein
MFGFFKSKWYIIYKPSEEKIFIIKSWFEPPNSYLDISTGILVSGGPYNSREEAEKDLPKIAKELNV